MSAGEKVNANSHHKDSDQDRKWRLKIGAQIHGPYRAAQLRSLVSQGMLTPHSLISPADADEWRAASEEPAIAGFFRGAQRKFGRRNEAPDSPGAETKSESANFVLITDIKADSNSDLEQAIMRMGQTSLVMRNIWVLHGNYTVGALRNALIPYLRPMDSLFIVDVNRGKNAGFNLGPEIDAKIRKIWKDQD